MTTRIHKTGFLWALLATLSFSLASAPGLAYAKKDGKKKGKNVVTLIEMGDLHGTLVSHAAVFTELDGSERQVADAGGLARLKWLVDDIRADNPDGSVLLSAGDLTHGSAETLFTVGDAMMKAMNTFDIDVFTPGNWDFGYGAAVFRNRFATRPPFPAPPPNITVMAGYEDCTGAPAGTCSERQGIIQANFPAVAVNLYNAAPLPAMFQGQRVLDPYKIIERKGIKIAVIGLTASIVPQQADAFNITFRFTQGIEELPGIIEMVKNDPDCNYDCLIVVQSELGLPQNLKIAQSFRDIDVMYSAHTHEATLGAFLATDKEIIRTTPGLPPTNSERKHVREGAAIVVETNRDMYVGRLDLEVKNGKVVDFQWENIPVDDSIDEDTDMLALVASIEAPFLDGPDFVPHTFMPGGFGTDTNARGLQLVDGLDTVVGETDTLLLRHHVLEDTLNNFIADAILAVTDPIAPGSGIPGWNGVDLSMANGFRFGNAVLPGQDITLRDLYTWFPIAPAVNIADFSGQAIQNSLNTILGAVFDRNVFMQRGGWYLGLANMEQKIDLKNRPFSSSGSRVVETKIGGQPLDLSKRYVFASCYGHGNPLDDVCRTGGGANFRFFALADGTDYESAISLEMPVNDMNIITGPMVKQVAPNNFLHPVHAMRLFLDNLTDRKVVGTQFGVGDPRVTTVDSTLVGNPTEPEADQIGQPDNTPDDTLVQPPFGAGPKFFSGIIDG